MQDKTSTVGEAQNKSPEGRMPTALLSVEELQPHWESVFSGTGSKDNSRPSSIQRHPRRSGTPESARGDSPTTSMGHEYVAQGLINPSAEPSSRESHSGMEGIRAQRTGSLVPGVGDAVGRFLLPLPSAQAVASVGRASAGCAHKKVEEPRRNIQEDCVPTRAGLGERDGPQDGTPKSTDLQQGDGKGASALNRWFRSMFTNTEEPSEAEPSLINGNPNAMVMDQELSTDSQSQGSSVTSLTAHDHTLSAKQMELVLPCRRVPIQGTRRMGNPVPTASSGGQSQESQVPDDDHSEQFREQHHCREEGIGVLGDGPDQEAGVRTRGTDPIANLYSPSLANMVPVSGPQSIVVTV